MKHFQLIKARSLPEARAQATATVPHVTARQGARAASAKTRHDVRDAAPATVLKAGGVDLLDLMKEGICAPAGVVSIKRLPGLSEIRTGADGTLRIGALVTLSGIEADGAIKKDYTALHEATLHAATPQVRNQATLGGNLAQRPRCWYFRSAEHPDCKKKGGSVCYALDGENEIHAIFNNSTCAMVPATSLSTALIALDARVEIVGEARGKQKATREVPLSDFFVAPEVDVTRETILRAGEVITAVVLPVLPKGARSYYLKQGAKESYDWALADVAVVAHVDGGRVSSARVVAGAVAPVPLRSEAAERALIGQPLGAASAKTAGEAIVEGATPLSKNKYKVPMLSAITRACVEELTG